MTQEATVGTSEVTIKIGWDRLRAIVNEQAGTILRTAFSPIVREAGDLAAAVFDRNGRMMATADTGTPGHINPIRATLAHVVQKFPPESLEPGDVIVINDPWFTTGQLLDVTVVTPAFVNGELAGFFSNTCHLADVGGLGMGAEANDIFEEGIYLPAIKLMVRGERNAAVWEMILANVRRADLVEGDLEAQMGANQVGVKGLARLMSDLKLDNLDWLADEILKRSEAAVRESIRRMPDGVYKSELELDGYGAPIHLKVAITIKDDDLLVDFTGTSDQIGKGINVVLNYTTGYTAYAVRTALSPEVPNNAGSLAPVRVTAPEGSVVNCVWPAATSSRHVVGQMVPGAVMLALSQADPPHCLADSTGATWGLVMQRPARLGAGTATVLMAGGTGARKHLDGLTARNYPPNVWMVPVEVQEQEGFVRFICRERRRGSGGEGEHRGGDGQIIELEFVEETILTAIMDRTVIGPQGALGGGAGQPGKISLDGAPAPSKFRKTVEPGSRVRVETPGGGGWGKSK